MVNILLTVVIFAALAGSGLTAEAADKREDLVIVVSEEMTTFDPVANSVQSTQLVLYEFYSTLFRIDASGQPQMELARSFQQDSAGAVITIPDNAKFEDGSDLTAEDVAFSLNRARASATMKALLPAVSNVEAVDRTTVRISTNGPLPVLRNVLSNTGCSIVSKAYTEKVEAGQGDWSQPLASGRYKLKERVLGDYVTIVKNENFWDKANAAQNNSLTFKLVPEASSRTIMVETGEADMNWNFSTADYNRVMENSALKLHENSSSIIQYFGYDVTLAPFDNKLVRQAMNYAIDRDAVVEIVADGLATPAFSVIPPSTLGYVHNAGNYSYDPEKAKALLTEAGHGDGFKIAVSTFNDEGARIAEVVQVYLSALGITAEINRVEMSVRTELTNAHQIPTLCARWGASADPDMVLPRTLGEAGFGSANSTFYHKPELEELYAKGRASFEPAERIPFYEEAQKIIMEDAAWCPIYIGKTFALTRADLQGVLVDPESAKHLYRLHY